MNAAAGWEWVGRSSERYAMHEGYGGATINTLRAVGQKDLLGGIDSLLPELVIINVGINDVVTSATVEDISDDMQTFASEIIAKASVKRLMVGGAGYHTDGATNTKRLDCNALYSSKISALGDSRVTYHLFYDYGAGQMFDSVHPDNDGHQQIADNIVAALQSEGLLLQPLRTRRAGGNI